MRLDLLRTKSEELCFSIFLVGKIYFPSWESGVVSLWGVEENLRGIRGQRPHGRRAPSPCPVGMTPSPQALQPLAEVVHRIQVTHHDKQLQEPLSILHR